MDGRTTTLYPPSPPFLAWKEMLSQSPISLLCPTKQTYVMSRSFLFYFIYFCQLVMQFIVLVVLIYNSIGSSKLNVLAVIFHFRKKWISLETFRKKKLYFIYFLGIFCTFFFIYHTFILFYSKWYFIYYSLIENMIIFQLLLLINHFDLIYSFIFFSFTCKSMFGKQFEKFSYK